MDFPATTTASPPDFFNGTSGLDKLVDGMRRATVSCGATANTWYNVLTLSGKGVLTFGKLEFVSTVSGTWYSRILVNSTQVCISGLNSVTNGAGWLMVGGGNSGTKAPGEILHFRGFMPFTTSLNLQVQRSGSSGAVDVRVQYQEGIF